MIRPARDLDAGAVGALMGEAQAHAAWQPALYSGAEHVAHAAQMITRGWVHVAEDNGHVQGFIAEHRGIIHALYVAQDTQGQGVGRALIERMQSEQSHIALWTHQANTAAQGFYTALGFTETDRSDGAGNDEGLPDIKFVWQREEDVAP